MTNCIPLPFIAIFPLLLTATIGHGQDDIATNCVSGMLSTYLPIQVAALGDTDGDGVVDYAAGFRGGGVYVYSGASQALRFSITQANTSLGASFCNAGDFNGDGFDDILAGNGPDTLLPSGPGTAQIYSGLDGTLLHQWTGLAGEFRFGQSVAYLGDVNADGFPDLAVSASDTTVSINLQGSVRVYSGQTGLELYAVLGDAPNLGFGSALGSAGDVNGDGTPDLVVGAFKASTNIFRGGQVSVFSGLDGQVLHRIDGVGIDEEQLGIHVAGLGDINQDGYADFAATTTAGPVNIQRFPVARLYSGVDGTVLHTVAGTRVDVGLNYSRMSVAGVGDANLDGYPDYVVGDSEFGGISDSRPGRATVYSGADNTPISRYVGSTGDARAGHSVSALGDVNGDGLLDVLVGSPALLVTINQPKCVTVISGTARIGTSLCSAEPNSTGQTGLLEAFGSGVAAHDNLGLIASSLPEGQTVLLLAADDNAFVPLPGGSQGNLCLGGNIYRYNGQVGVSQDGVYSSYVPITPGPDSVHHVMAGDTWFFQAWHREMGGNSNFTQACSVIFQ